MDINIYLHYNNVALIDPQESFHASCIKQFETKGYLTSNQLTSLRNWAHSPSTIERLTAGIALESTAITTVVPTVTQPVNNKSKRWTVDELDELFKQVEEGNIYIASLAKLFNREESSVANILYKQAEDCTIKKGRVIQFERAPF